MSTQSLSWILSHLCHLRLVCVTHSNGAIEVKPTNKDIGIRSLKSAIYSTRERRERLDQNCFQNCL